MVKQGMGRPEARVAHVGVENFNIKTFNEFLGALKFGL